MKLFFHIRICLFSIDIYKFNAQLSFLSTQMFLMLSKKTDGVILKWKEPDNNGAVIIEYSVYQRFVNGDEWKKIATIFDVYNRSYAVEIEKGKEYEFVVTATNKYGESSMEQDIKRIKVLDGRCINNYF